MRERPRRVSSTRVSERRRGGGRFGLRKGEGERDGWGRGRVGLRWVGDVVGEEGDLVARCRPRELLPLGVADVGRDCCWLGAEGR